MSENGKSPRDAIRAQTVGSSKVFRSRKVVYNGIEIEIREPSVEGWGEIIAHAHKGDNELSFQEFLIWSVIYCAHVPGTEERVYDAADYDSLKTQPKSGFVGEFSDIANELMALDTEKVSKNLGVTAGGKQSSPSQNS